MAKQFPEGFLWGAATSAHQVEGGTNNNWIQWEKDNAVRLSEEAKDKWQKWQQNKFPEMFSPENYISGRACDHYTRYEEDFNLAKDGGHNAHRFSIEWSRIEPEEGRFDEKEIEHYRKIILALRERGIEPFVTLWHWTHPLWVEKFGGPANKKFAEYFAQYAEKMAESFGDLVKFWVTVNEPTSVIGAAYMVGIWPPQKRNIISVFNVYKNLSQAHNLAYDKIHEVHPNVQIGFANVLNFIEPNNEKSLLDKFVVGVAEYFSNKKFLNSTKGKNDFLTLQYYFHKKIEFPMIEKNENKKVSDLGWELYPQGLYYLLKKIGKYNLPIYITENGLADSLDENREWFLRESLRNIKKAIDEGVNIKGYFYWSLLDNFEWDKGFWPRFGLIEIDYKTLERKPRKSFYQYAKICQENAVEIEL